MSSSIPPRAPPWANDAGLLFTRLAVGSMMLFGHGLPKLLDFSTYAERFADPLGVGSTASLVLAILGEVVCSVLIIAGAGARLAALPFLVTMLVAGLIVHGDDPWARKELALLYAALALALVLTGAGRFSIDALVSRMRRGAPAAPRERARAAGE